MRYYLVVIEKAENNYGAYSPDVPGCVATGQTIEETLTAMKEALEFHFEGIVRDGEEIPMPKGLAYYAASNEPFAEADDFITSVAVVLPLIPA